MKILLLSFGLSLTVITASAQSKGPLVIPGRNLGEKATYTRPDDAICQPALNIPFGEKNDRALTANESTIRPYPTDFIYTLTGPWEQYGQWDFKAVIFRTGERVITFMMEIHGVPHPRNDWKTFAQDGLPTHLWVRMGR